MPIFGLFETRKEEGLTESSASKRIRALRRRVRLLCTLSQPGRELLGYSFNLSASGIYVQLPPLEDSHLIRSGTSLGVSFALSETGFNISTRAKVVWTKPDDRDIRGHLTFGIGLLFVDPSSLAVKRLTEFVEQLRHTVLVLEDEPEHLGMISRALESEHRVIACSTPDEAFAALEREEISVIVSDQKMPEMTGAEFLQQAAACFPYAHTVKIIVSAYPELEAISELLGMGTVFHYLRKPFRIRELRRIVARAIDSYRLAVENERLNEELARVNRRLRDENAYLRQRTAGLAGFEHIVGQSERFRAALEMLELARSSDITIHIRGETGTGKDMVAQALHFGGPRRRQDFIAQNCAGLTETLIQSTLFGHKRGAFTGAERDRPGVFQQAHKGTLFLDEVAELPLSVQGGLLRVLQDGEVTPVGSTKPTHVDVRVISATHRNLKEDVRAGRFREDLFYRLVVIDVELPPLRARRGDIRLLAEHYIRLHASRSGRDIVLGEEVIGILEAYAWPGNVRELDNEIERAVVLAGDDTVIAARYLSPQLLSPAHHPQEPHGETGRPLAAVSGLMERQEPLPAIMADVERRLLMDALQRFDGNQAAAARYLGVPRQTLRNRLSKLGLA